MKIKSSRNYEKKILGTSDTWSTSHMSHRPSEPAYYIVDCRISLPSSSIIKPLPNVVEFYNFLPNPVSFYCN